MSRSSIPATARHRTQILGVLAVGLGAILFGRLWYVQVLSRSHMSAEVARQSIRRIRLSPVRGRMIDREGEVLVDNRPSYDIVFHLSEMRQRGPRSATIDHILSHAGLIGSDIGREPDLSREYVDRRLRVYPAVPLKVFRDLDKRELALVSERLPATPGVELQPNFVRRYPHPGVATHLLGFTGRRRPPDEFVNRQYSYVLPELRGRTGLERVYDHELSGTAGMKMMRVDSLGYVHEQIGDARPARDGSDLTLTIDARAQTIAERLLAGKKGALVVMNVKTGEVLTMASVPTYNLAALDTDRYAELVADAERRPLFNRAVSGSYLPGSIVKPLIGLAALESGAITPEHEVTCGGAYVFHGKPIRCWLRSGHGKLGLIKAIEQSCNTYFIDTGLKAGLDNIRPVMLSAGLGEAPEIDLPGASRGLVPSRPWARQHLERSWLAIDTAYLSIGQGTIGVSPLQAAVYAAALANGGTVYRPFLVSEIRGSDGRLRQRTAPTPESNLTVQDRYLELIRQGMKQVVQASSGSGRRAAADVIKLAGKTGTAEVQTPGDEHNNTWFIGYGPTDAPKYAIAVLVEYGNSGGRTAAPIAGTFFSEWLAPPE